MKIKNKLDTALDYGLNKNIFDHIRNYMMCAMLFASGVHAYNSTTSIVFGLFYSRHAGSGMIIAAFLLSLLNFYDGARKLAKFDLHIIINIIIFVIYSFFSIRLIELILDFRIFI